MNVDEMHRTILGGLHGAGVGRRALQGACCPGGRMSPQVGASTASCNAHPPSKACRPRLCLEFSAKSPRLLRVWLRWKGPREPEAVRGAAPSRASPVGGGQLPRDIFGDVVCLQQESGTAQISKTPLVSGQAPQTVRYTTASVGRRRDRHHAFRRGRTPSRAPQQNVSSARSFQRPRALKRKAKLFSPPLRGGVGGGPLRAIATSIPPFDPACPDPPATIPSRREALGVCARPAARSGGGGPSQQGGRAEGKSRW